MSELVFLLSADIDIQDAYEFHEAYQEGRGTLFLRHLDAAFGQLRNFPESGPIVHGNYRRLLVLGYPYGIFYVVEPRGVVISAVMDNRQDPDRIVRRLR